MTEPLKEPLKIWLYGRPFSGKTYFASQFPKPLILSTDGNARFYSKDADYVKISSLADFQKEMNLVVAGNHKYETIILDVTEHLYEYVRDYYLDKNNVDDESEMGGYAIGWRTIRGAFWKIVQKLANTDYNVIFISHEETVSIKDALGREKFSFRPALPEKLHDKMSGIVQLIGRAHVDVVELNGERINEHYISFGSQPNELSGVRVPIKSDKITNTYSEFIKNMAE